MKNVKKQAMRAALRSRCKNCTLNPHRCTSEILRVCTNTFVAGYTKGVKAAEKQSKMENKQL